MVYDGNAPYNEVQITALPDLRDQGDGAGASAVFTNLDTLQKMTSELIEADLGASLNVSDLLDDVQHCCRNNGTERHSVEQLLEKILLEP